VRPFQLPVHPRWNPRGDQAARRGIRRGGSLPLVAMKIDLHSALTFRSAFRYPLQSELARRELLWGALLVLLPGVGWILNMGHRIQMVHQMQHGQDAWPAWRGYPRLFRSGLVTFLGMAYYY
jgi:hypothetical protein